MHNLPLGAVYTSRGYARLSILIELIENNDDIHAIRAVSARLCTAPLRILRERPFTVERWNISSRSHSDKHEV